MSESRYRQPQTDLSLGAVASGGVEVTVDRGKSVYYLCRNVAGRACNHRCTFCAVDYIGYKANSFMAVLEKRLPKWAGLVLSIMFAGEGDPICTRISASTFYCAMRRA